MMRQIGNRVSFIHKHPVITFFALAYAITWSVALALQIIAQQSGVDSFVTLSHMADTTFDLQSVADQLPLPVLIVWLLTRIVDFGPTLAAIILSFVILGKSGISDLFSRTMRWRVSAIWYIIAIGLPALLSFASVGVFFALEDDLATFVQNDFFQMLLVFVQWILIRFLIGGGLGEELGWRGFALTPLQDRYGLLKASLIIGIVWTFWHLPAHIVSGNFLVNVIVQLLVTIPYSIIFSWVYIRSGKSIFIVALLHAASNAFIGVGMEQIYPILNDEVGWVLIYILLLNIVAIRVGFLTHKKKPMTSGSLPNKTITPDMRSTT